MAATLANTVLGVVTGAKNNCSNKKDNIDSGGIPTVSKEKITAPSGDARISSGDTPPNISSGGIPD